MQEITTDEKVTLYNDKEISSSQKTVLTGEEIDTAINVETKNEEDDIYKGKLYSGIDRQYNSITELNVNLANVEEYITIKEEELMENGLEVDDFLQNDGRTESFLRKIISMAEEEVGYKVQGGNITIQVAVLPEHTLALTFSEKPELGISNMLENLKSAVESLGK